MEKSFYKNYYGGFYNRSGKQLALGDIVLSAVGDIVEKATGDIVYNASGDIVRPAKGDIVNGALGKSFYDGYYGGFYTKSGTRMAKGDIVNAKGDIINAKGDIVKNAWGEEEYIDYADYMAHGYGNIAPGPLPDDEPLEEGGFLDKAGSILDLLDQGTDTFLKLKDGANVEAGPINYDIEPTSKKPKNDLTLWYVIGGAIVVFVIVGVVLKK